MKNIVFDIGNVLVKWLPSEIVATLFPEEPDQEGLTLKLFKSPIWYDLNLGKLTVPEAVQLYKKELPSHATQLTTIFDVITESLTPVEGGIELLEKVQKTGRNLYSITDNVKEIMAFLRIRYTFLGKFKGVISSADVGLLKPNPQIYQILLNQYDLIASETLFIDDVDKNVIGARDVGMQAIHFTSIAACEEILRERYKVLD